MHHLRLLLLPFSLVYGVAVWLRNCLYNWGWLKQTGFDVPVIVVGNLAVGGTGKTPMTEYLIHLLAANYRIATLSRGYGRSTRGFREVRAGDTAAQSGDEPLQFKRKFPGITVAVCEDRVEGVQRLVAGGHEVIVLDDAFQHRALKPGLALLLFDYHSMLRPRWLLPAGNYRDWFAARKRADILVVTKTPATATSETRMSIRQRLAVDGRVPVLFAGIAYGRLIPIGRGGQEGRGVLSPEVSVLLVTGIANPDPLYGYLAAQVGEIVHLRYGDHHPYSPADIITIKNRFAAIANGQKLIITTEKDSQRLSALAHSGILGELPLYMLPIRLTLNDGDAQILERRVLDYCAGRQ